MTDTKKIAAILEFIDDAEDALTDPYVLKHAGLKGPIQADLADAKKQIIALL